jgi:hypothetical protein
LKNFCFSFLVSSIFFFLSFLRSPILLSYRRVQRRFAVSARLEKVSFLFFILAARRLLSVTKYDEF